ncbi:MAG TPA: tetratricopeptide repeat protein [Deltaproteobacteria bacterium]|jgi:tetratricopeptide (TPR) repeat protein|nr:tetratricopeptide repeat protein [Deltaproteobacteria bacterium]
MSSIYEALQRIQGQKNTMSPSVISEQPRIKERTAVLILIAVIVSSLCTAAVFFGIRSFMDGKQDIRAAAVTSTAKAGTANPISAKQNRMDVQGHEMPAKPAASAALPSSDSIDDYLKAGERLFKAKDYDNALLVYTKAMHYFKKDVRLLNNIGNVFLAEGQTKKAIHYFKQANKTSKNYVEPVYNLACAYAKLGNRSEALTYLEMACSMNPEARRWASEDPDLQGLKGNARFDRLIGTQKEKGEG